MALIQANRESIDDRFSVLGFTVRTENPLFEIALAAHPDLLKGENRAKRTASNFFSSRVLGAMRNEAVYLVPPNVVARFVGQPRLYFGLATYKEGDRSRPVSVKIPDAGSMYVNTSGLTERGLRRTARGNGAMSYGNGGDGLVWGGDAPVASTNGSGPKARNGNGASAAAPNGSEAAPYSDGYSDDLWKHDSAAPAVPAAPSPAPTNGGGSEPRLVTSQAYGGRQPYAKPLLVEPYDRPSSWWDALTTQIGHFARGAMWFLGVTDTTQPPYSAICQVRRPDGTAEGAHMGTAFFIGPRLLLTAAHVVDGQSELIIVPGKNGGGTGSATEPFGRFRVTQFRKHGSYGTNGRDNDMALICVPAANAASAPNYFGLVEELTQSRPEGVVVSGYAAWWHATSDIAEFVNNNIDENRQHAHGGYIRELPTDGTFTYDLQTLAGTSGSPVYWIENGGAPCAHLVGVHVAANDDRTNRGCRITQEKLRWIRETAAAWGQTLTFSLGAARSLSDAVDGAVEGGSDQDGLDQDGSDQYSCSPEPVDEVAAGAQAYARSRALDVPTPDYPNASRFAPAHANNYRVGRRRDRIVDRIVIHITAGGPSINGTISWFQNGDRPNRSSSHYIVGRDGEVVQMVRNADTAYHASSANSRSIGIEHNANKPYKLNRRDLPPTEPQYEASARLVAWLCAQYNLPIDREHIIGHIEATPSDNHDCPSSIWDWDHYMACVQIAASQLAAPSATSQGVRALGTVARALDIITPFYDPADPASALTCQADAFSLAREEWFAGVPNTTIFPHSAICLLEMRNSSGNVARGTGFYIGPNRILTCGHNLHGMASVDIIPGKNGNGGSATEPFGRCMVTSWRIPASYGGSNPATDLAVIDNVPLQAPNYQWFDVLEELNQSRPEGVVVCGYSSRSVRVPDLTAAIDGFKQHLHAGYIAALGPGDSTFDYPILTLKRASGSPVYYISNKDGANKAYIVGVHTGSASDDLNRGCRLTNAKIDWIEGRTTALGLGYGAQTHGTRSLNEAVDEDSQRGIEGPIPDDVATSQSLGAMAHAMNAPSPEYPQARRFVPADSGNYRTSTGPRAIERVVIHITDGGANINGTVGWFQNPAAKVSAHYVIGQDGEIVQMVRHNDVAWHARSANRTSIGIEHVANTRGLNPTPAQMCASAALVTWLCDAYRIPVDRTHVLGHSEADTATTHTGCPNAVWNWDYYMGLVNSRTCYAPDTATAQAFSARALEIPLDPGIGGQSIGLDALSPGDIIVSTARHAVSYAIRAGTLSAISHAMIYVGGGNIVEAVGDGVREVPLANAIGDAILAVAYRDPRVDAAKAQVLVDFARAQVGRPYNYGGVARIGHRILFPLQSRLLDAIRSLTGTDDATARSFFCSELVFAAFEATGIPLVAATAGDSTPSDVVALTRGSLGYVGHLKARDEFLGIALGLASRSLGTDTPDYGVALIPQPDKNACWAASMSMLLSYRRNASYSPETLANEVGRSLASSYNWDLLNAVRSRYGFEVITQPSNASLYHTPQQWADWLNRYGPLWVVIVGAPHAVVVAGIKGNLADPASVQVKILNPWDTRVAFDNDPVAFNPRNNGYEDWLSFNQFAADFGNMAQPDYGNWRVLYLPASAASAQSLGVGRRLAPAPAPRTLGDSAGENREPIEPTRVPGTRMSVLRGSAGASRWALDQLEGLKSPATPGMTVSSSQNSDVTIELGAWPAIEGEAAPLPLTVTFRSTAQGAVGDVQIRAGTPANLLYGVEVVARIEDDVDVGNVAAVKVGIDYRFSGLAQGSPAARIELRLLGDGRYERVNRWVTTAQAA